MRVGDVQVDDAKGRASWTFTYRTREVMDAAQARADYHREREAFYRGEAAAAEAALRDRGIQLREHQQTGGPRMQAVLDPEQAEALASARSNRDRHADQARTFETYVGALGTVDHPLQLTLGDVEYFGLYRESGE